MNSPFSDRSMITDPARFFGRKEQLRAIFNALAAAKPQCVSIIGERRIGRSSLLKHFEETYKTHLPKTAIYHFAYLNVARDTCRTPNEFYAEAAQALLRNPYESLTPHEFDDLLIPPNTSNRPRYVLLLDEFNALQRRHEQFDDDFYDGLRARANNGDLTFVLASHLPLHEIAVQNNFSSTFFGIFTPVFLEEFTLSEALDSVFRPTASPPLRNEDFDVIKRLLNKPYHPLKLNIAADLIWHALPNPKYNQLKEKYQQQVDHAFGHATSKLRRKTERQANLYKRWNSVWDFIINNKLYIAPALFILVLYALGFITPDQVKFTILEWAGIPTLTPTPIPTLTPTP